MGIQFEPGKGSFGISKQADRLASPKAGNGKGVSRDSVSRQEKPVSRQDENVARHGVASRVDAEADKLFQLVMGLTEQMASVMVRLAALEAGTVERTGAPSIKGKSRADYHREWRAKQKTGA